MGYGPGKLELVLEYLPSKGSLLELGYQKFHSYSGQHGDVGDWFIRNDYVYECLDTQEHPFGAAFDLNCMQWRFGPVDVVTNFGTTEHIMDQCSAFRTVHDACKVEGVMIHEVPHCRANHGMFGYNPSFFNNLAKANKYKVEALDVTRDRNSQQHILAILRKAADRPFQPALDYSTR